MNAILIISLSVLSIISLSQSHICPDKTSKCSDDMTCCKWTSGKYGCCPLVSGQCCADGLHCCPNGTKCNDKEGTCDEVIARQNKHQMKVKFIEKIQSNRMCPDKNDTCARHQTCCKQKSGSYGCCPYDAGVCCKDLLHCCPRGTQCDIIHRQCVRPSNRVDDNDLINTNERMRLIGFDARHTSIVVCPGGRYDCPANNTCCPIDETQWGCCPLVAAVCCADRIHCCPLNTKCRESGCESFGNNRKKNTFISLENIF